MIYNTMYMGGVLVHGERAHKYLQKIKTKAGKWRYIYENTRNYGYNKQLRDKLADNYHDKVAQDKIEANPTYWGKNRVKKELKNYYDNKEFNKYLRYGENPTEFGSTKKEYLDYTTKNSKLLNEEGRNIEDQIKKHAGNFNSGSDDPFEFKKRHQENRVSTKGQGDYDKLRLGGKEDWYKATSKKYQKKMDDSIQGITKRKYYTAKAKVGKALNKLKKKH